MSPSKRLADDAEPHRHDERPSKVLRLSGVADGHQVAGSDQHSSMSCNSYMRTIQVGRTETSTDMLSFLILSKVSISFRPFKSNTFLTAKGVFS